MFEHCCTENQIEGIILKRQRMGIGQKLRPTALPIDLHDMLKPQFGQKPAVLTPAAAQVKHRCLRAVVSVRLLAVIAMASVKLTCQSWLVG